MKMKIFSPLRDQINHLIEFLEPAGIKSAGIGQKPQFDR